MPSYKRSTRLAAKAHNLFNLGDPVAQLGRACPASYGALDGLKYHHHENRRLNENAVISVPGVCPHPACSR
jgi:hypothetical protein